MARLPWKRVVWSYFPAGFEKSVYAFTSGVVLTLMYLFWIPMTEVWLWHFENPWLYYGTVGESVLPRLLFCWSKLDFMCMKWSICVNVILTLRSFISKKRSQHKRSCCVNRDSLCIMVSQLMRDTLGNWSEKGAQNNETSAKQTRATDLQMYLTL